MSYTISNSSIKSIVTNFKNQFIPVKDKYAKMTFNGDIACPGEHEYRAFINGVLTSIPEELLLDVPFYRIVKPIDQVKTGDIIVTFANKVKKDGSVDPEGKFTYRLVNDIKDGKICTSSYGGSNSTITPVADFFMGQKTVYVLINLFAGFNGAAGTTTGFNPMMLALLSKDGSSSIKDLLPLMLMQQGGAVAGGFNPLMLLALKDGGSTKDLLPLLMMQQGGAIAGGFNPMMLLALSDGDSDLTDLLLMQAVAGQNGGDFTKLFGAPVASADPIADTAAASKESTKA